MYYKVNTAESPVFSEQRADTRSCSAPAPQWCLASCTWPSITGAPSSVLLELLKH